MDARDVQNTPISGSAGSSACCPRLRSGEDEKSYRAWNSIKFRVVRLLELNYHWT